MVKGLEKLLKTTRNILLTSIIGSTILFTPESNITPSSFKHKQPFLSQPESLYQPELPTQPKLYTEIHSKFPEEQRKIIEYIFEDLMPPYLIESYIKQRDIEALNLLTKIKKESSSINLDIDSLIYCTGNFCDIPEEGYNKFKEYGYLIHRSNSGLSYGKLDSEEEILDDSWKEFGKKPTKHKVITYYPLPEIRNNIVEFSHKASRYKFEGSEIIYAGEDKTDNIIYIDISNIKKLINDFIRDEIEYVKYYEDNCNHIKPYFSDLKDNVDFDLEHIVLLEFDKIVNFDDLSSHIEYCRNKNVKKNIGEMKNNLKDPNFKENLIKEYKRSVFIHETNHPQNPIVYIENGILKPFNNFVENPDEIIPIEVTPEFNEFIAYFSEIANVPSHPTVRNFREVLLKPNDILKTTPHGRALVALAILYNKKLYTKFNIKIDFNKLIFDYLMNFYGANEIKNLSKDIYKDIFLSCPTPEEILILLDIHNKESCLISKYESSIER